MIIQKWKKLLSGICASVMCCSMLSTSNAAAIVESFSSTQEKTDLTKKVASTLGKDMGQSPIVKSDSLLYGDVNQDSIIDASDVNELEKAIDTNSSNELKNADVNGDGTIDGSDITMINAYISGDISYFPVGDFYVPDISYITRAEWIHSLVVEFDMSVDDESTIEEFFTDIDNCIYAYDINLAANFGVFDIDSETFVPDAYVTREFLAHTMNFCLGFSDDVQAVFDDAEDVVYAGDAEIAVERNWIELIGTEFRPDLYATQSEIDAALSDMRQVVKEITIDENYNSEVVTDSSVIILEDTVEAEMSENTLVIKGSRKNIVEGDTFSVELEGNEIVRKAVSVFTDEETGYMTIEVEMPEENVIESQDAAGYAYVDYDGIEALDGDVEFNIEDVEELSLLKSPIDAGKLFKWGTSGTVKVNTKKLNFTKKVNVGGGTITIKGDISKLSVPYAVEMKGLSVQKLKVGVDAVSTISGTLSTSMESKFNKDIPILKIPVYATGALNLTVNVSISMSVSGELTLKYTADYGGSIEYTKKNGWRIDKYFHSQGFEVIATVEEKIGAKLSVAVDVAGKKFGELYLMMGEQGKGTGIRRKNGMECMDISAHLIAEIGANFSLPFGIKWSKSYQFINAKNSPLYFNYHFENDSRVNACTYGKNTSGETAYIGSTTADGGKVSNNGRIVYTGKSGNVKKAKGTHISSWIGSYTAYTQSFKELTPPAVINEDTVLTEDTTYPYGLTLNADLDLNGHKLTVNGDFYMGFAPGILNVNHNKLIINKGSATITGSFSQGKDCGIIMENKTDYLCIESEYKMTGYDAYNIMTAGTLELKGDVTASHSINSSDMHTVILSGTKDQTFNISSNGTSFNMLDVKNSDTRKLIVDKYFIVSSFTTVDGKSLSLVCNESGNNASDIKLGKLTCDTLNINGSTALRSLDFYGYTINANSDIKSYSNDTVLNLNGATMNIKGSIDGQGKIILGGGTLNVDEDFDYYSYESGIYMTNKKDRLYVGGDFTIKGGSYSDFTDGIVEIKGDIYSYDSLNMRDNSKLILSGNKDLTIYMSDSSDNINELEIQNLDKRNVYVDGYFKANSTDCGENPLNIISRDGNISLGDLTCSELNVTGDISFYGTTTLKCSKASFSKNINVSGTLDLNGKETTIKGDLNQTGGTLNLRGATIAATDVNMTGGTLYVNKGTLNINGDMSLNGKLYMENDSDLIKISGDLDIALNSDPTVTAGTIECAGDITSTGSQCFVSTGTFKMILNGEKNQTLNSAYYPSNDTSYHFANLEVKNSDSRQLIVKNNLDIGELTCDGKSVQIQSNGGCLNSVKLRCPLNITGDIITSGNIIDLNGYTIQIDGNLYQHSGTILLNTGKLYTKDYLMVTNEDSAVYGKSDGILNMTNDGDLVCVNGNFLTNTTKKHTNYLTAGKLEIKGDFHQMANGTTFAFPASGTHRVLLNGNTVQNVKFDSYDDSHFNILELSQPKEQYVFNEEPCWIELAGAKETTTTTTATTTTTTVTTTVSSVSTTSYDTTTTTETTTTSTTTTIKVIDINSTDTETVNIDEQIHLECKVDGYEDGFTWSSSDPNIATVDNNGILEILNTGEITVTATDINENIYEITIVIIKEDYMLGDIDNDGIITISDAIIVLSYYAQNAAGLNTADNLEFNNIKYGDIDNDSEITISDAIAILTYYAKNAAGLNPSWN